MQPRNAGLLELTVAGFQERPGDPAQLASARDAREVRSLIADLKQAAQELDAALSDLHGLQAEMTRDALESDEDD